jgi:hypothetical protein
MSAVPPQEDSAAEAAQAAESAESAETTATAQVESQFPTDQAEFELEQPVLVPPRGLVWVTLAALSLSAAGAILFAPPVVVEDPPSLQLQAWQSDEAELSDMRRRIQALLRRYPQAEAPEQALRGEFALWLAQEATQGQLAVEHDFDARMHLARAEEQARQLVIAQGQDALQAAAARFGLEVREALEELLRGLPAGHAGLASPDTQKPSDRLDQIAPGMRAALTGTGIERQLHGGALVPAAQLVVEALAAQRILSLGSRVTPRPALPSDVQALLLRWRVEAHEGLPVERRAQLLAQLEAADPGYPSDFTAGVWAARGGDCQAAVAAWQRSLARRQMSVQARANIRWCQAQLSRQP